MSNILIASSTEELADKFGVTLTLRDPNGYWRSTEFEYVNRGGYTYTSKNFSLVIERHCLGTHPIKLLNGFKV